LLKGSLKMKEYVVSEYGKFHVVKAKGFVPQNVVGEMIQGEDPEWLQLEDIQDPVTGEMVPTLTIDDVKKAQVLAQRLQDEVDAADDKAQKDIIKQAKKDALKAFKGNNNKTLADITKALDDIIDYIQDRDGF